ncbi:phage Gp37/Gp68 family protein [bacterium]|nr:phage Gp37/Gp68 family protein [bacterium]
MALKSAIEWTETTWNPVTGCTKVSEGCENCYAERFAIRLQGMGAPKYKNGFKLTIHPEALQEPLHWRKPRLVFVCSMSDLFHPDVPTSFIRKLFEIMSNLEQHTFQVLTKRPERLLRLSELLPWTRNIWVGTTVEKDKYYHRIYSLVKVPAKVRFISAEPLLGPLHNLPLKGINWVIVGGESGPGARYMSPAWVREIRDQCVDYGVAFFFKQWGGINKKRNGRVLDNKIWNEYPRIEESLGRIFEQ